MKSLLIKYLNLIKINFTKYQTNLIFNFFLKYLSTK